MQSTPALVAHPAPVRFWLCSESLENELIRIEWAGGCAIGELVEQPWDGESYVVDVTVQWEDHQDVPGWVEEIAELVLRYGKRSAALYMGEESRAEMVCAWLAHPDVVLGGGDAAMLASEIDRDRADAAAEVWADIDAQRAKEAVR